MRMLLVRPSERIGHMVEMDCKPSVGEGICHPDGLGYTVRAVKHFPERLKDEIKEYKKFQYPFVRLVLSNES